MSTVTKIKRKRDPNRNTSRDYVNNKELFQKFLDWRATPKFQKAKAEYQALKDAGIAPPEELRAKLRPTDAILLDAWKIVNGYAKQRKFNNIPEAVLEESCALALEFCIRYLHNFNPEKTNNPFSYITQISNNAIFQLFKVEKLEKQKRLEFMSSALAQTTYVRSDGEIDLVASDLAEETLKFFDQVAKEDHLDDHLDGTKARPEPDQGSSESTTDSEGKGDE